MGVYIQEAILDELQKSIMKIMTMINSTPLVHPIHNGPTYEKPQHPIFEIVLRII